MKRMFKQFMLAFIFVYPFIASAQEEENKDKAYTPYELLSSYYGQQFHPFKKSNIYMGLAFSVEDKKLENTDYLVKEVINGNKNNFDIEMKGGYYIGNYTMIGLTCDYFQKKFTGDVFQNSDTIQSNSITRGFSFTPYIRPSFPLTANERLSFYTEIGLTYGHSTTLDRDITNFDEITKTCETINDLEIGISPGVTFFAMENFAFEVKLNVLGYSLKVTDTEINNTEHSRKIRHNVDFNLNLLSLDMGLAYYFGPGLKK